MNTDQTMDGRAKLVDIGDAKYIIEKMTATRSLKMQAQIVTVLGPVLADLTGAVPDPSSLTDEQKQGIGAQLMALLPQLDMDRATDLVIQLCQSCRHASGPLQGQYVQFDNAFADDLMPAYELAVAVADYNFAKYFKALAGNVNSKPESEET